ncbi:MAG: hypothetical protein WKF87_06595 [Chryseolinea sp.]
MIKLSENEQWEQDVTRLIAEELECTNSEAQGIVEAQSFYISQAWGMNVSPEGAIIHLKKKGVL